MYFAVYFSFTSTSVNPSTQNSTQAVLPCSALMAWKCCLVFITFDVLFYKRTGFLPALVCSFSIHKNQWQIRGILWRICCRCGFFLFLKQTMCRFCSTLFNTEDLDHVFSPVCTICDFKELFNASSSCHLFDMIEDAMFIFLCSIWMQCHGKMLCVTLLC